MHHIPIHFKAHVPFLFPTDLIYILMVYASHTPGALSRTPLKISTHRHHMHLASYIKQKVVDLADNSPKQNRQYTIRFPYLHAIRTNKS